MKDNDKNIENKINDDTAHIPQIDISALLNNNQMQSKEESNCVEESEKPVVETVTPEEGKTKTSAGTYVARGIMLVSLFMFLYFVAIFSNIPFVVTLRTLYIETAMSTNSHQWLATAFIPKAIIDEVMQKKNQEIAKQEELDGGWDDVAIEEKEEVESLEEFYETYWELDSPTVREYLEKHSEVLENGWNHILIEDMEHDLGLMTSEGDAILAVDVHNGLILLSVKGDGYVGKLALAKDPTKVQLEKSAYLGGNGQTIDKYGERENVLLAINASGFTDVDGHGSGGEVKGSLVIDGVNYGSHSSGKSHWKFIGMKKDNHLYVTNYNKSEVENYRWAVEFSPALIIDGEIVTTGSSGWGIQPRTAVGQAKDGTFMFLIVDGRQAHSIGCTVGECAIVLNRYHAYQAANLDGGSSSIMWYNGSRITKSSSPSGYGRYLPNAIVLKKSED